MTDDQLRRIVKAWEKRSIYAKVLDYVRRLERERVLLTQPPETRQGGRLPD